MRSAQHVLGLPDLTPTDAINVQQTNELANRTCLLGLSCIVVDRVPFATENPAHSFLWSAPQFKHLRTRPGVTSTKYCVCRLGEEYLKETTVLSYGFLRFPRVPGTVRTLIASMLAQVNRTAFCLVPLNVLTTCYTCLNPAGRRVVLVTARPQNQKLNRSPKHPSRK